jgi:hypothetical protein
MKTYLEDEAGNLLFGGAVISPSKGNRFYVQALAEEESTEARILRYVAPELTADEGEA